ncbi:S8 family serine peptidase, partial [Cellulomonas fimi]|uniref:S8 family serine peptidase n=1 Tax=Cellulomonas fimi TaxID=1708 RepID=UPI00234DB77A
MLKPRSAATVAMTLALAAVTLAPAAAWSAPTEPVDPTTTPADHERGDLPRLELPEAPPAAEPDQVLVRFSSKASASDQRGALSAAGVSGGEDVPGTRFVAVPVGDEDPEEVVERLAQDPAVADVQVDHVRQGFGWTNDPYLTYTGPYVELTRQPRVWDFTAGQGTVVAVLDSGVYAAHEDLVARMLPGTDLVDNDADPSDPYGHGTLVAGVAAATGNNGRGAVGVAHRASILPVRVLDAQGYGTDSRVAAGIAWAVARGADVINLSLGGPATSPAMLDAIRAAVGQGVVVVAAAGNTGTQVPQYPAAYAPQVRGLLSVSATDDWGALAGWSTWGDTVSISAPGNDMVGPGINGGYVAGSGTSFAAPVVSGAAALLTAASPRLDPGAVEDRLVAAARDAGPRGYDPYYGAGIVDVASTVFLSAAVAVPLDRAPGDPGQSDDTAATARRVTGSTVTGQISPEGDVDWYAIDVPAAGGYRVSVAHDGFGDESAGPSLDLALEVQDGAGNLLGEARDTDLGEGEETVVQVAQAGTIRVGVSNENGSAPTEWDYVVTVEPAAFPVFTPTRSPASASFAATAVVAADFTGDGKVDALTVGGGKGVSVYPGKGDGTLGARVEVPSPGLWLVGEGLVAADVDGDKDSDAVATTNLGFVVLKQSGGTLTPGSDNALSYNGTPVNGRGIAATDWDGDGDTDVVVSSSRVPSSLHVMLNDGTGAFTPGPVTLTQQNAGGVGEQRIAVGDLTGDGRPDVVTTYALYAQRTDGTFAAPVTLPPAGGPLTTTVDVGDVTGDGRLDVVRISGSALRVSAGRSTGGFAPEVQYPIGSEDDGDLAIGDLNADGLQDVVVVNAFGYAVSVLWQRPGGTLSAPAPTPVEQLVYASANQVALAHLDGDGRLDAVVAAQDGVLALRQSIQDAPRRAWLTSTSVAPHTAGVAVRPTVRLGFGRQLDPADLTSANVAAHVVLKDRTGATVPATVALDGTSAITVRPSADLGLGDHFSVVVTGLHDTSGGVLPAPVRVPFTVGAGGERYTPVPPERVLDTRSGLGGTRQPTGARLVLDLSEHLPTSATAVVLNLTATRSTGPGN